jgi:hypothetical protein
MSEFTKFTYLYLLSKRQYVFLEETVREIEVMAKRKIKNKHITMISPT